MTTKTLTATVTPASAEGACPRASAGFLDLHILKELALVSFGQFLGAGFGLLAVLLTAHMLTVEEFGLFTIFLTTETIAVELTGKSLDWGVVRFSCYYLEQSRSYAHILLAKVFEFRLLASVTVCLLGLLLAGPISQYIFGTASYRLPLALGLVGAVGMSMWWFTLAILQTYQLFVLHGLVNLVNGLIKVTAIIVLLSFGIHSCTIVQVAYVAIAFATFAIAIMLIPKEFLSAGWRWPSLVHLLSSIFHSVSARHVTRAMPPPDEPSLDGRRTKDERSPLSRGQARPRAGGGTRNVEAGTCEIGLMSKFLHFSKWPVIANLFMMLHMHQSFFLLLYFAGPAEVGVYSSAWRLVFGLDLLSLSMMTVFLPKASRITNTSGFLSYSVQTLKISLPMCALLVPLLFVSDKIMTALYPDRYADAALSLQILLLGSLVALPAHPIALVLLAANRPNIVAYVSFTILVLSLGGNLLLIPGYGGLGAACVAGLSKALYGILLLFFSHILIKKSGRIIDL